VNHTDPMMWRMGLYAVKDIREGSELSLTYVKGQGGDRGKWFEHGCYCDYCLGEMEIQEEE
jgi:hypothetical protein